MKYINQSILIITIAALSICNCVLAQTKTTQTATTEDGRKVILKNDGTWEYQSAPQSSPKTKETVNAFDTKSFDLKQEKLPTNYKGHNPELIFNILQEWVAYRADGETMDSFRERQQLANKEGFPADFSKKIGGMTLDSIFAFQAEEIFPKYDENSKTITPSFDGNALYFRGQISYLYINKETSLSSYIGQNVYGAQATVKVVEQETFQILATNGEKFLLPSSKSNEKVVGTKFEMDAATASQARTNMKALLICKLVEPYGRYKEDTGQATLSNTQQTNTKAKALVTEILEIWYYDIISGKIYYKQKPN